MTIQRRHGAILGVAALAAAGGRGARAQTTGAGPADAKARALFERFVAA